MTILEAAETPFARLLGRELGELLAARYRAHGVDVMSNTRATAFRTRVDGRLRSVVLPDRSEVECDTALVSVGVEPAAELMPPQQTQRIHLRRGLAAFPGQGHVSQAVVKYFGVHACGNGCAGGQPGVALAELDRSARAFWLLP